LEEWRHSDAIVVKKNPYYWDKAHVKLSGIELIMVNEETELKMYQKEELDWAGSPLSTLPLNALSELKKNKLLHQKPFLGTYFFRVNTQKAPFDNLQVRKALALALNRAEIVEHVTQGGQEPATGLIPLAMRAEPTPYFIDGDRAGAKEALAGIDLAVLPEIKLLYISGERNHLIAQAVQQQWAEALGIEVKLEGVERKIYYDRISKKDFQLSAGSWTADYNDPMNFLEVFKYKTNGSNNTFWEDSRYGALLDQAEKTISANERSHLFQTAEKILIEQMPIIPVFHYTMLYLKNDRVQDVAVSALGSIDFKWAYLMEDKK
jgi:oligopeptide transport system substrate-binding protein